MTRSDKVYFSLLFLLICTLAIMTFKPTNKQESIVYAQVATWPHPPYLPAPITFSSSGDQTVVAAVTNSQLCVYGLYFVTGGTTNITFKDGTTAVSGAMGFVANGAGFWALSNNPQLPWFQTSKGKAFVINSSSGVQVSGSVYAQPCP